MKKYTKKIKRQTLAHFKKRVKWANKIIGRENNAVRQWGADTLIQVHPWADDKKDLKRLGIEAWQCANADCYWRHGDTVCLVMISGGKKPSLRARRDAAITKNNLMIFAHVKNKTITSKVVFKTLNRLASIPEIWKDDFYGHDGPKEIG